jgi:glycosyltransferase involved in cell wall biosynthesis
MRKVLLIAYYYPPQATAGALRPAGLVKYLPHCGWEPIVLTPRMAGDRGPKARLIETGDRDVLQDLKAKFGFDPQRKLHDQLHLSLGTAPNSKPLHSRAIEWFKRWLVYDYTQGWIPFALEAVAEFAKHERVDAILTTSPPESCHIVGAQAKRLLGCPWIADFRDLWTQNLGDQKHTSQPLRVRQEKRTLAAADALVTVSEPWARRLRERYSPKPIYTIHNGFDPDEFRRRPQELTKSFSITYAGTLYGGKRDPSLLLEVLKELISEQILSAQDVRVRFYVKPEPWLPALIAQYGLGEVVELHGFIGRAEVLQREMESQVLLLLGWSDPKETGQHSGKLFEYFGAARPILAVGGSKGVLTEVLAETKTGIHALSKEQLRSHLIQLYADFKQEGRAVYHADPKAVERYSHSNMAEQFAEVLESTTSCRSSVSASHSLSHNRQLSTVGQ